MQRIIWRKTKQISRVREEEEQALDKISSKDLKLWSPKEAKFEIFPPVESDRNQYSIPQNRTGNQNPRNRISGKFIGVFLTETETVIENTKEFSFCRKTKNFD